MKLTRQGLLVAAMQLVIVLSLGAKLLYDRFTRPRAWALCEVYDPNLPIRGRYVAESLRPIPEGFTYAVPNQPNVSDWWNNRYWAFLSVRDNQLIASAQGSGPGMWIHLRRNTDGSLSAITEEPVLIFIPDTANFPALKRGEELWVEVTLPAKGPPRPIRLALKNVNGFTPLHFN
jgi:hypothetical protein